MFAALTLLWVSVGGDGGGRSPSGVNHPRVVCIRQCRTTSFLFLFLCDVSWLLSYNQSLCLNSSLSNWPSKPLMISLRGVFWSQGEISWFLVPIRMSRSVSGFILSFRCTPFISSLLEPLFIDYTSIDDLVGWFYRSYALNTSSFFTSLLFHSLFRW